MADRRLARKTILVRRGSETIKKIEIFDGDLFEGKTFLTSLGEPIPVELDRADLVRVRLNGKWFPGRRKILFQRHELNELLFRLIGE